MVEHLLKTSISDAGSRLDTFLAATLKLSRSQVARLIKEGAITLNDRAAKPSLSLRPDEAVRIVRLEQPASTIIPQNIPLDILYSDEAIAVINKACGLVVHPGAGVYDQTLCNALLFHFPAMSVGDQRRPGIVHRLDKNTSGVMIVAKTHHAHQFLSAEFRERRVEKIYRAFCHGELMSDRLELKTGHMRHPKNPLKFYTKIPWPKAEISSIRRAHTTVEVINRSCGISAIRVTLHTGRTHQIRAHLADSNFPLCGDTLYGGARSLSHHAPQELRQALAHLEGQALHAETISFNHPVSHERMSFCAPLPKALLSLSDALQA